jgi:hypothetical protein
MPVRMAICTKFAAPPAGPSIRSKKGGRAGARNFHGSNRAKGSVKIPAAEMRQGSSPEGGDSPLILSWGGSGRRAVPRT